MLYIDKVTGKKIVAFINSVSHNNLRHFTPHCIVLDDKFDYEYA